MRLIDADALKGQFAWLELRSLSKKEIFKIINEAPTVETSIGHFIDAKQLEECASCTSYMSAKNYNYFLEGYRQGKKDFDKPVYERERLKVERVQEYCVDNECKGCHNNCTWFKCPICNIKVGKNDNFCKHCGAELITRHECKTCRYSDLKITEEPCYSCVYSGETDNINLTDRWESK